MSHKFSYNLLESLELFHRTIAMATRFFNFENEMISPRMKSILDDETERSKLFEAIKELNDAASLDSENDNPKKKKSEDTGEVKIADTKFGSVQIL